MNKKYIRKKNFDDIEDQENSQQLLYTIQKKLDSKTAINGGFDRLLYKIDGIEQSQSQIVAKVDKIHDAIYDPDDGLFARISTNKTDQIESISKVEKQIIELNAWKQGVSKLEDTCEKENDMMSDKLKDLENSIDGLNKFQSGIHAALKWFGAAIGGGIITMLFKIFYNALAK